MLVENVFPIFPAKSILMLPGINVTRLEILITPNFAVIDYKV